MDTEMKKAPPTVVVLGASGFVGRNLVRALLSDTSYHVRAVAHDMSDFTITDPRLEVLSADVFSTEAMHEALKGADIAYYLVHMLTSEESDFYTLEARAAETFARAAKDAGVSRVIYMSGLGRDTEKLSQHLASRHNTGDILRSHIARVIEFRSSIIVGQGSASFEIIRTLVSMLPLIILPAWSKTLTQPIGLPDVLQYLVRGSAIPITRHEIIEIGGPEKLSYQACMKRYAKHMNKHCYVVRLPTLSGPVAGSWLRLFLPKLTARIGSRMVESFRNEMTVTNTRAFELFPDIVPRPFETYFI